MTYTALIRSDSPVGYWKLNGSGSAVVGPSVSISNPTWTGLPLVVNSGSALVVKPSGASVSIYNQYNAFYKNFEEREFTFEFWFSFNGLLDGSGYLNNLDSTTQYFNNNNLDIVTIDNGLTQIGSIYYNYLTNTFRFKINGASAFDAYVPVRNLNNSFYVVAGYSNRSLKITVNGEQGILGSSGDTSSLFPSKNTSSVYFNIDGAALNPSASMNYVISDFAIYDTGIPMSQQRRRVLFALDADKPSQITKHIETSYFDVFEREYQMHEFKSIEGSGFDLNLFDKNNLHLHDVEGIVPHRINQLHMTDAAYAGSAVVTSSGVQFITQQTALLFNQFGELMEKQRFKTVSCQVTPTTSSTSYIFSITNCIDGNQSLYVLAAASGFELGQYDHMVASATPLLNIPVTLSPSTSYDVGICIDNQDIYFYGEAATLNITVPNLLISRSSQMVIGNLFDTFLTNTHYIKNLSINNEERHVFTNYDFTENKMFMARLTNDFSVGQMAKWIKTLNLANYENQIVGTRIAWDGMDNCLVEVSDDGFYWTTIKRGHSIPNIKYNDINRNKLLRVSVPFEYTPENNNQSFNNLDISIYKNLTFVSNDGEYSISPMSDSTSSVTYTIKRTPQQILLRQDKFGLFFEKIGTVVPGYAKISPTSSSIAAYGVDFWVKFDSFPSASNFLIDVDSMITSYLDTYIDTYSDSYNSGSISTATESNYLYVSGSTNKLIFSPSATSKVYLNGASIANNSTSITIGDFYHIFYDFGGSVAFNSSLGVNGSLTASGTHAEGSYGHINIWNSTISAGTASARYAHFVANNITPVVDTPSATVLWQPNWTSDSVTSVFAINIG